MEFIAGQADRNLKILTFRPSLALQRPLVPAKHFFAFLYCAAGDTGDTETPIRSSLRPIRADTRGISGRCRPSRDRSLTKQGPRLTTPRSCDLSSLLLKKSASKERTDPPFVNHRLDCFKTTGLKPSRNVSTLAGLQDYRDRTFSTVQDRKIARATGR